MREENDVQREKLSGMINLELWHLQSLQDFCTMYIPTYNRERFRPVALRVFAGKETIITIYALDQWDDANKTPADDEHLLVKKFKIEKVGLSDLLTYVKELNFTINVNGGDIYRMEVINK